MLEYITGVYSMQKAGDDSLHAVSLFESVLG